MDLIDFHFVFPDFAHAVEQISHFNTWLNPKDVPTLFQILPRCSTTVSPFQVSMWELIANMESVRKRMTRGSQLLSASEVVERMWCCCLYHLYAVITQSGCALVCL